MSTMSVARSVHAHDLDEPSVVTGGRWRSWVLFAIVLLPFVPFVDHRSAKPDIGPYSWTFAIFLASLPLAAAGITFVLFRIVRRAPENLQLALAIMIFLSGIFTTGVIEVVLGLRGADAFAMYRHWGHVRSQLMGFEAAPSHRWEAAGATYTTDASSFRTHLRSRPPREQERLIVVMGESSAFGFGLNDDEAWPHLLEGLLRDRVDENITVLNAANNGHNTLQQLIRYYTRVQPLKPEMVIYYGAINDVRVDSASGPPIHMPVELLEAVSERDYLRVTHKDAGFYFRNSLLLHQIKNRFESLVSRAHHGFTERAEREVTIANAQTLEPGAQATGGHSDCDSKFTQAARHFVQNLETMRLICEANGTRFVAVSFLADVKKLPPMYREGLPQLVDALGDHYREDKLSFIDLRSELSAIGEATPLFAKDHYHPSRQGALFLAERLATFKF